MPLKPVINVKCPCCKEILEIDVEQERVRSHRKGRHLKEDRKAGEDGMDVALRQVHERRSALAQRFDKAREGLTKEQERLDRLFREAQEKARRGDDEPEDPENPFRSGKIWD